MKTLVSAPLVEKIRGQLTTQTSDFLRQFGRRPKLAVVLVGDDPASVIYTRKKGELAIAVGMEHETLRFPSDVSPDTVRAAVATLNLSPTIDGILIQRPLPKHFPADESLEWVIPEKDVDAFHPINAGKLTLGLPCFAPCTPAGVMELMDHYGISVAGKIAAVVGRSSIVGKPMGALLLQANATVLQCHSQTPDLGALTRQADILVVAAGKPNLIRAEHIKSGAVVVDVGIHRTDAGKVIGDVDQDSAKTVASALTPVPGGVGPMTIAILLKNTLRAAQLAETRRN